MLAEARRSRIAEIIRAKGFAALPELAGELRVSESTVRRDLEQLEDAGIAKRTHGGAFYSGASPRLLDFEEKQPNNWEKKQAIAQVAANLIEEGETVLLDGGSTTYEVALLLVGRRLQIVTNSLPVANLFAANSAADLILVGGYVYPRTGVALGPYADQMLKNLHVRHTILSVAGIDDRGLYNSNLLLVETERAMIAAAEQTVIVADSTKFGHQSLARLAGLEAVDQLVVDDGLESDWQAKLAAAGVAVHLAPSLSQ